MGTKVEEEITYEIQEGDLDLDYSWGVTVFNNDYTPFDFVVIALLKSCDFDMETAIYKTMQIHHEGESLVKTGLAQEDAIRIATMIENITSNGGQFKPAVAIATK